MNAEFDRLPLIRFKNKRNIFDIEDKVINLYARGLSVKKSAKK